MNSDSKGNNILVEKLRILQELSSDFLVSIK
jgi:hypothetical protein